MEVLTGILFHGIGASCAALCYTPEKKVRQWSWQSYWLAQALVCWLLLPIVVAWITIPDLGTVLREAPTDVMVTTFLLGMAYGVGGTAFGMAIRYVGYSLTYAISVGLSCVLGTIIPPLVRGDLGNLLSHNGSGYIVAGMVIGVVGIALCGRAGRGKEKDLSSTESLKGFSIKKGLPLCILAGVLSAVYGFSLDHGQPIAEIAAAHGAGNYQGNVIYIFSNSGAFLTTLIYCSYLHTRGRTWGEYGFFGNAGDARPLLPNFLLATLTGILWYFQFFFYGFGHVRMGTYKPTSWAIHMIMLVMLSALTGLLLREWKGSSRNTMRFLFAALLILVSAVIILTFGNYLGGQGNAH